MRFPKPSKLLALIQIGLRPVYCTKDFFWKKKKKAKEPNYETRNRSPAPNLLAFRETGSTPSNYEY